MSPIQTLAVGVRLFSVWLVWYGLTQMSSTYFSAVEADYSTSPIPFVIGAILIASICLCLWLFPTFVAKKIFPRQVEDQISSPAFDNWFSVGCSLIGVWALSKAIPALGSYLAVNYLGQKLYPELIDLRPDWHLQVAFNIFQLLFGVWLFLGGKGLRNLLKSVRSA